MNEKLLSIVLNISRRKYEQTMECFSNLLLTQSLAISFRSADKQKFLQLLVIQHDDDVEKNVKLA